MKQMKTSAVRDVAIVLAASLTSFAALRATEPEFTLLPRAVLKIPTDLKGYYKDPA